MFKKNILILCGGQSTEHKISLISATNVYNAIDTDLFNPILVAVDTDNNWHYNEFGNLI